MVEQTHWTICRNLVRPRLFTLPCSMQPLAINPLKGTLKICHGPIHNLSCAFCTAIVLPSKDLGTYCTTPMQPTTVSMETHQSCLYFLHDCRTSSKRITCNASIRMADTHRLNPKTDRSAKRKIYDQELEKCPIDLWLKTPMNLGLWG